MPSTSIHDACRRGDINAVRALIAADPAVVDADDEHGWRPIFHAGLWRQEQVVRRGPIWLPTTGMDALRR